jgi:hypothetical protein
MARIDAQISGFATLLSRQTVETLIDLVDNKLTCMEVFDRDDAREQSRLRLIMDELQSLLGVVPGALESKRRGRPAKAQLQLPA